MVLSQQERQEKLNQLIDIEGFTSLEELLEEAVFDSVCIAICVNSGCSYTEELEPDQDRGVCAECGTPSMKSALILAGMI